MLPLVSVIIPNFNYARFLPDAINSVLNQTYSNIEVIVVNNGSTDDSMHVLKTFQDSIKIIDQANLGQSGARNSGIRLAKGNYLAFLDADDIWFPNKIEQQISKISPDAELIYSGLARFQNDNGEILSEEFPLYEGDCCSLFLKNPGKAVVLGGESTVLFSRELLEKVGYFDLNLNSAAGWDFFRRCSQHTHFRYVPEILVKYRIHGNNLSNSAESNINDIRMSFFKLIREKAGYASGREAIVRYLHLEWSFLKTFLIHRNFRFVSLLIVKLPKRFVKLSLEVFFKF